VVQEGEGGLSDLAEIFKLADDLAHVKSINRLKYYEPYPYQKQFHNAKGYQTPETAASQRLLMAANKVGKTYSAAMEVAIHATGLYPDWWDGTRYISPPEILVCGLTNDSVRDLGQRELLGDPTDEKALGTGTIPKLKIGKRRPKTGVPNAVDSVRVQHVSGGWSRVYFRAYEQGWKKFQGIAFEVAWPDEEPPIEIWSQLLRATLARKRAIIMCTMTPEEGMTEVVTQFMESLQKGQALIGATWDDARHLTPEVKEQRLAALRPHERDMRSKGIPLQGAGLVFTPVATDESMFIDPIEIPRHWPQVIGVDFGISTQHPFSAANLAWDRDTDTVYMTAEYQTTNDLPAAHIDAINAWGTWKPVAWPHDGANREKGTGDQLQATYRKKGLNLLPWKATNPPTIGEIEGEGGNSVEASVLSMLDRMLLKKWKVFKTCTTWQKEGRMYHRNLKGQIVRMHEDLICASRYAHMMVRHARTQSVLPARRSSGAVGVRQW
jgi:phage terminase large subunit-like protein